MESKKKLNLKITLVLLGFIIILLIGYAYLNQKDEDDENIIQYKDHFLKFVKHFNKNYKIDENDVEYKKRFENFKITMSFIEKMNLSKNDSETIKFGLTKFSDLTDDEFKKKYLNDNKKTSTKYNVGITSAKNVSIYLKNYLNLPLKIDWRDYGIITDVRNQGNCGSCYAQSVIGTIESSVALNYNLSNQYNHNQDQRYPLQLSVQQMIDCAENFNEGCMGGDTCDLLEWLKTEKIKILPKEFYPDDKNHYLQRNCKNITLTDNVKTAKVIKYTCLDFTGHEYEMLNILAKKGPLTASVNGLLWKNYLGGVIKYHCNGASNHAIEIVGYDLTPPDPYYIVRNSWGIDFGNDGYAKVGFGKNVCNIASEVSMVQVEWG